jgi:hypothetical protein
MKKLLFVIIALAAGIAAHAQNKIYCELVEERLLFSSKVNVQIDFGQETKFFSDTRLVGKDGKAITFNSMVDALNYMAALGWRFEEAYVVQSLSGGSNGNSISTTNTRHWILSKDVDDDYSETLQSANQLKQTQ